VLSQEQDGREVVLAYALRTLSKPERNYDVTRRELLAVVFGLKIYRHLLVRQFVIRTDHSALQSLRRTPEPIGQQARWQAFIEQIHCSGTRHQNADALSRRPFVDDNVSSDESSLTRFVELSQWVPHHLTLQVVERKHQFRPENRWPNCSKATQISVRFCDGNSSKLNNPDQRKL